MKELQSYVIENDTDQYAVVLDDQFQLFNTQKEADDIREEIFRYSGGSNHIQDTAFSFYDILAPQSSSDGRADGQKLSECKPCNLRAFMAARRAEINNTPDPVYDFKGFFGDMLA